MMIIGRKLGMSHFLNDQGHLIPVTLVCCDTNVIVGYRTAEIDGYAATIIATRGSKHINKSLKMQLKKSNITQPFGVVREFRSTALEQTKLTPGSEILLSEFKVGDMVVVSSVSKGKGFAGTIKRHNFSRGPKSHGSNNYRQPGAIGAQQPQRVIKGKKMAGHLGAQRVSIKNLKVVKLDQNLMALQGSVPGPNRGLIMIKKI